MRVKCLAQEHKTMTRPGLEPGPLDPESGALTTRQRKRHATKKSFMIFLRYNNDDRLVGYPGLLNYICQACCLILSV